MASPHEAREQKIRSNIGAWLEEAVIGLNLCPFAGGFHRAGQVRIVVSQAAQPEDAVASALDEARLLLEGRALGAVTTLVVVPDALSEFDVYLDAVATLDALLSESGCAGLLQVATMHPHYQFEGEAGDALSSFTNRSPYPIFHLLREEDVSRAVDSHPDPGAIPSANIATLQGLGPQAVAKMWSRWEHRE